MCGISGVIFAPGKRANESLTKAMAMDMAHRGPDAQTGFTRENFSFSHRRLKVIDTSDTANQPIFNEEGNIAVIFNGEIYNYKELRSLLLQKGHVFKTQSDTEVIVHSFEEWGTETFSKFNGVFAFALWDGRSGKNKFFLVRDRMGIKPLFYSSHGCELGFSSELKPLLRLPWVGREIESHTLFEYLKFSHVPNPLSILKDVQQLEPGHYLSLGEKIEKYRYWDSLSIFQSPASPNNLSDAQWEERFEHCLHNVVKRQVISDVPIGCFLSGGIDSSLLAMAFSDLGAQKVNTFSIGYKEKAHDETGFAKLVSSILNTQHHELIVGPKDFFEIIPEIPRFFDQPLADPTLLSTLLLSKFARNHVTVTLSGDGADELFWGYDYQRILSSLGFMRKVPTGMRAALFATANPVVNLFSHRAKKLLEILQFKNEQEFIAYFIGTVGPMRIANLATLVKGEHSAGLPNFKSMMEKASDLNWNDKIAFAFQNTFLVDTVLAKSDRASMAYGLEARVPFLDNEMLEFSQQLPFDQKYRDRSSKFLLRAALGKRMPPEISARRKQGFSIPIQSWLRTDLKYLLDEYIFSDRYKNDSFFQPNEIKKIGREHLRGKNHSHLLWSIISFRMWQERYLTNV